MRIFAVCNYFRLKAYWKMSFTQVNELRKNGRLNEAYEMAMEDLNQAPDDVWAARALFWAMHDIAHAEARQGYVDRASELAGRMEALLPQMGQSDREEDDALPERALARLIRHLQPFYADVKMAYQEARNGDTIPPYDFIVRLIQDRQLTEPLHERAGWIICNHLWKQQQYMPATEARQALAHYIGLAGVQRPSSLHSHILMAALRLAKRFPSEFNFAAFLDLWGEDKFMPGDWQRVSSKKGKPVTYPSLVEQAISGYINFKKQTHDLEYRDSFVALLEQVVEKFPDKDEYKRYLSLHLFRMGDKERSLELHRQLAMTLDRYYVWHELAQMFTHDLDMKTSALCKALSLKTPENFVCDIHRELGWELAREGNMSAALRELETYRADREQFGWPRTWRYEQLRKRIPDDTVATGGNAALYAERAQTITDWVFKDVPQQAAVVVTRYNDNQGRFMAKLAIQGGRKMLVKSSKLPADSRYLAVRLNDENGRLKLLTVNAAERNDIVPQFAESVTGNVRIMQGQADKQYGFVEGCFVPGHLLKDVTDGDTLTLLTEMQPDGRRRATAVI